MARRRRTKKQQQRYNKATALMNDLNKGKDEPVVFRGKERYKASGPRISTGIPSLDLIFGGGVPMHGMIELYGRESSGKTHIACLIAKQFQRKGHTVLYMDAENSLDPEHVEHIGVDLENLHCVQESGLESVMRIINDAVESEYAPELIVLDSVAALSPESEEVDNKDIALPARLLSRGLRIINAANKKTLIVLINQARQQIGGASRFPVETTSGGRAMRHYAKIRAEIRRGMDIKRSTAPSYKKHLTKKKLGVVGHEINIKVIKNKTSTPFGTTRVKFYIDGHIDIYDDIVTVGLERGGIKQTGGWYNVGSERLQGRNKLVLALRKDKSLVKEALRRA